MDYHEDGQRIRRFRKAKGISQETLAEKTGISTTHMSHIETANTWLSLPVFVAITETLEVSADALLYDTPASSITNASQEIDTIHESSTAKETRIIAEIIKTAKRFLGAYLCFFLANHVRYVSVGRASVMSDGKSTRISAFIILSRLFQAPKPFIT